jgi:hypothetical protein
MNTLSLATSYSPLRTLTVPGSAILRGVSGEWVKQESVDEGMVDKFAMSEGENGHGDCVQDGMMSRFDGH